MGDPAILILHLEHIRRVFASWVFSLKLMSFFLSFMNGMPSDDLLNDSIRLLLRRFVPVSSLFPGKSKRLIDLLVVVSKVELLDALIAKLRATDVSLRLVRSVKPISHLLAVAATQRNGLWSVVRCQEALFLVQQRALLLLLWV